MTGERSVPCPKILKVTVLTGLPEIVVFTGIFIVFMTGLVIIGEETITVLSQLARSS